MREREQQQFRYLEIRRREISDQELRSDNDPGTVWELMGHLRKAKVICNFTPLCDFLGLDSEEHSAFRRLLAYDFCRKGGHGIHYLANSPFGAFFRFAQYKDEINRNAEELLRASYLEMFSANPNLSKLTSVLERASNYICAQIINGQKEGKTPKEVVLKQRDLLSRFRQEIAKRRTA